MKRIAWKLWLWLFGGLRWSKWVTDDPADEAIRRLPHYYDMPAADEF